MTTAIVIRITQTGINNIVHVRPAQTVVFYGWNDTVIKSVTPMPDGVYILDGQHEDRDFLGQSMPTVAEIVTAFEEMAVEMPAPEYRLKCENCETEISEPNGGWPKGVTAYYCPCGHETEIVNVPPELPKHGLRFHKWSEKPGMAWSLYSGESQHIYAMTPDEWRELGRLINATFRQ